MSMPAPPATLLSLPTPVCLKVYDYVLFTRVHIIPLCSRLRKYPKFRCGGEREEPGATTALLRTCRQVHHEATPILYASDDFLLDTPANFVEWLDEIGPVNMKHVARIRIYLYPVHDPNAWHGVLRKLALQATGLKYIYAYLDAEPVWRGVGRGVGFIRGLGALQSVQRITIEGFYAKHWPEYLRAQFGSRYVHSSEMYSEEWYRTDLRKFQRGTEDLVR